MLHWAQHVELTREEVDAATLRLLAAAKSGVEAVGAPRLGMLGLGLAAGADDKLDEAPVPLPSRKETGSKGRPKVPTFGLGAMLALSPPPRRQAAAPPARRRWLPLMSLVVAQGAYAKPKATQERIPQVPEPATTSHAETRPKRRSTISLFYIIFR